MRGAGRRDGRRSEHDEQHGGADERMGRWQLRQRGAGAVAQASSAARAPSGPVQAPTAFPGEMDAAVDGVAPRRPRARRLRARRPRARRPRTRRTRTRRPRIRVRPAPLRPPPSLLRAPTPNPGASTPKPTDRKCDRTGGPKTPKTPHSGRHVHSNPGLMSTRRLWRRRRGAAGGGTSRGDAQVGGESFVSVEGAASRAPRPWAERPAGRWRIWSPRG